MEITLMQPVKVNAKYFRLLVVPRYLEDCDIVNNVVDTEDITNEIVKEKLVRQYLPGIKNDSWSITIDIDSGEIVEAEGNENGFKGMSANVYFKVCDQGDYYLLDENKNVLFAKKDSYVPSILDIEDEGYGDYIYIKIEDGFIKDWNCTESDIIDFVKNDDEY